MPKKKIMDRNWQTNVLVEAQGNLITWYKLTFAVWYKRDFKLACVMGARKDGAREGDTQEERALPSRVSVARPRFFLHSARLLRRLF